ncbi:MAG: DUF1573 domain-containing protein [Bacteroidota bacterium]|jgi:hypothetical protein
MKKLLIASFCLLSAHFVQAQDQTTASDKWDIGKVLEITNTNFNAGERPVGQPVDFVVEIKNIGKDSVTLINAKAGCGCTTPNFTPNQRFGPGQTVKVAISYNGGQAGSYGKVTTIYFDHEMSQTIMLTGVGVPPKQEAAPAQAASPVKH